MKGENKIKKKKGTLKGIMNVKNTFINCTDLNKKNGKSLEV